MCIKAGSSPVYVRIRECLFIEWICYVENLQTHLKKSVLSSPNFFRAATRLTQSQTLNLAMTPTLILKPNPNPKMFGQQDECLKRCIFLLFVLLLLLLSPSNKPLVLLLYAPAAPLLKELSLICSGFTRRSPDTGQGFDVPPPPTLEYLRDDYEGVFCSVVTHPARRQQRAPWLHFVTEATVTKKNKKKSPLAV